MSVEERIELLKLNILHYTKDLLNFDVVEIRLLVQNTGSLEPLLSVGMEPEASERPLSAQPQDNGVTGFCSRYRQELSLRGYHRGPHFT